MQSSEMLKYIRTENHLTQEEMAAKLYVTRQAVSRWENGETVPSSDTLRLIAKEFGVSVDAILGVERGRICQSCTYPLHDPAEYGTNADGTWNPDYCIYCWKDGKWERPDETVKDIVEYTIPYMTSPNHPADKARAYLEELVPTLKRWKEKATEDAEK